MDDIFVVTIVKGQQDLFENLSGHLFTEELSFNDAVEELAASTQPKQGRESLGTYSVTK